jgi:MFS family permease
MASQIKPSLELVSSPMDSGTSVTTNHCGRRSSTQSLTVGAPLAGRLSDVVLRKWQKKRKGVWSPEDRLRATWIGGLFMVPLSIGVSGLLTAYVGGPISLLLNLLCLFVNGMGVSPHG